MVIFGIKPSLASFIIISADAAEIHPVELVMVKLYVSAVSPVIVVLVPIPVIPPGLIVQFPAGNPFSLTLPVLITHVGWVIDTTVGANGVPGLETIVTLPDAGDVQPAPLVTV